jgi:hypothetical protein
MFLALRRRSIRVWLRPETLSVAIVGVLYVGAVLLFTPDYVGTVLPLIRDTYWAYAEPWNRIVGRGQIALLVMGLLIATTTRRHEEAGDLAIVLAIAALGGWLAFLAQRTSWAYHLLPCYGLLTPLLPLPAILALDTRPPAGPVRTALPFAVAAGLVLLVIPAIRDRVTLTDRWVTGELTPQIAAIEQIAHRDGPVHTIFVFSSSLTPAFPLVNTLGVEWSSRYPCLWPLPALIRSGASANLSPAQRARLDRLTQALHAELIADLHRWPPDLVVVDTARYKQGFAGLRFEFIDYFSADPAFALLWRNYAPVARVGVYQVFRRRPASAAASPDREDRFAPTIAEHRVEPAGGTDQDAVPERDLRRRGHRG